MKPNTKTIIILVVAAVAAYLLWKKGVFSKGTASVDSMTGGFSGPDPNNLEDVIAVAFGNDAYATLFAERARKVYSECETSPSYKAKMQSLASTRGRSYAQQVVINGAYELCYKNGAPRDTDHYNYFKMVEQRVDAM